MTAHIEVASPCKVNPTLEVLARRADGRHEVATTLLALDRCDRLRVERLEGARAEPITLRVHGPARTPDVPAGADNLAVRGAAVARDLARARGLPAAAHGLALELEKHVPSRAGLGGGSSNAAAAAYGAARVLGLDPDDGELRAGLRALGADVAFFLEARTTGWARCTGAGERVEPLPALPASFEPAFVVLTPALTCATAEVYAALLPEELRGTPRAAGVDVRAARTPQEWRAALVNDLEPAATRLHPALGELRAAIEAAARATGGPARAFLLAGSGSSFFGLFDSRDAAEAFLSGPVAARIDRDYGLRAAFVARPRRAGVGA